MTAVPALSTCAGPACDVAYEGGPAYRRFCSERCRRAAYRQRARAKRPAPEGQKAAATSRRTRVADRDPEQVAADIAAFRAALERETEASLRKDPSRWRHAQAADPDEHRRRVRRQPWRSTS